MMTDEQSARLQSAIQDALSSLKADAQKKREGIAIRFPCREPRQFQSLLTQLGGDPNMADVVTTEDFTSTAALSTLGPIGGACPPRPLRARFFALAGPPTPVEQVFALAVAFGCGNKRSLFPGVGGWDQIWHGAFEGLVSYLEVPVHQAVQWLSGFGFFSATPLDSDSVWVFSRAMALWLVHPVGPLLHGEMHIGAPDAKTKDCLTKCAVGGAELLPVPAGTRMVFLVQVPEVFRVPAGGGLPASPLEPEFAVGTNLRFVVLAGDDHVRLSARAGEKQTGGCKLVSGEAAVLQPAAAFQPWACCCGHYECLAQHRVGEWDLTAHSLREWIASAVKGVLDEEDHVIKANAFAVGIFAAYLGKEGW